MEKMHAMSRCLRLLRANRSLTEHLLSSVDLVVPHDVEPSILSWLKANQWSWKTGRQRTEAVAPRCLLKPVCDPHQPLPGQRSHKGFHRYAEGFQRDEHLKLVEIFFSNRQERKGLELPRPFFLILMSSYLHLLKTHTPHTHLDYPASRPCPISFVRNRLHVLRSRCSSEPLPIQVLPWSPL